MKNEFETYSLNDKKRVMMKVESKIVSDIRGHFTYNLIGFSPSGYKISALVNKEQWEQFDVPVETRKVEKKINRKKHRLKRLNISADDEPKIPKKSKRRIYNEEIENWLIEHYDLNLDDVEKN